VSNPPAPQQPLGEDEFLALAIRFLDGAAEERDRLALEAELFASRQRRDQFVELCLQRGELSEMLASDPDNDGDCGPLMRRGDLAALLREEDDGASPGPWTWGPTQLWMGGLGLGFTVLLLGWFGWQRWSPAPPVARGFDPFLSPQYIATLTASTDATWGESEVTTQVGTRLTSGRLVLLTGGAEVTFDSGARVVLQGPTTLLLESDKGGELELGRLVARVPERGKGFAIRAAKTQVIDLGTEFGVALDHSGEVFAQVFSGRVQLQSSGPGPGEPGELRLLESGEAVRFRADDNAEWETTLYQPNAFLRRLPGDDLRFPKSMVGYWNFDEQGGPILDSAGSNDGLLKGGAARIEGLVGAGAARFEGEPGQRVDLGPGGGKFSFDEGITIEALFVSEWSGDWYDYDEFFRKEDGERRVLLSFQCDHNRQHTASPHVPEGPCLSFGLNIAGVYSELDVPLDGKEGRPALAALTDGRAHHIAATYDARSGVKALYIDGVLRMSTSHVGPIMSGGASTAFIGNQETNDEAFRGVIDEVAIYREALPAETIAEHWRKAQAGLNYFQ